MPWGRPGAARRRRRPGLVAHSFSELAKSPRDPGFEIFRVSEWRVVGLRAAGRRQVSESGGARAWSARHQSGAPARPAPRSAASSVRCRAPGWVGHDVGGLGTVARTLANERPPSSLRTPAPKEQPRGARASRANEPDPRSVDVVLQINLDPSKRDITSPPARDRTSAVPARAQLDLRPSAAASKELREHQPPFVAGCARIPAPAGARVR